MKTKDLTRAEAIKALIAGETVINCHGDEAYWDEAYGPMYANKDGEAGMWSRARPLRIKSKPRRWVCPDGSYYEEVATFEEAQYAGSDSSGILRRYVHGDVAGRWVTFAGGVCNLGEHCAWVRFVPASTKGRP